ncbi:DUF6262 family protein [Rhodococcus sp. AW25M09]|uniref:DUF6262 family protein n=1 Tax=Rhodococcus sp. AW25M09 TaxID=1268303 RepID=UPI003FA7220D
MRADNSSHLRDAAAQRSRRTRERAEHAIAAAQASPRPITVAALARSAGVTRSWVYTQPDLIAQIAGLNSSAELRPRPSSAASDNSWKNRVDLAHRRIVELTEQNAQLRHQLALAHGQLRHRAIATSTTTSTT